MRSFRDLSDLEGESVPAEIREAVVAINAAFDKYYREKYRAAISDYINAQKDKVDRLQDSNVKRRLTTVIEVNKGESSNQLGMYSKAFDGYFALIVGSPDIASDQLVGLWVKFAQVYLAWGDMLYRQNKTDRNQNTDEEGARQKYEYILKDRQPVTTSPLYRGVFYPPEPEQRMVTRVERILEKFKSTDLIERTENDLKNRNDRSKIETFDIDNSEDSLIASILAETLERFHRLDSGLNYLGFREDHVPIMSYEHLHSVARAFTQFAAQANREYITYKQRAEDESFALLQMEQAVMLNEEAYNIEQQNFITAREERGAAEAAKILAEARRSMAEQNLIQYRDVGEEIVRLEEALAWANAASVPQDEEMRLHYEGLEDLGISFRKTTVDWGNMSTTLREYRSRADVIQEMTRARAERSYKLEEDRLRDNVQELRIAEEVANNQILVAQSREVAAALNTDAAKLRWWYSLRNLEEKINQEMNADLYNEIAGVVKETAKIYLERAIQIAFLMEQAYEFESGVKVNKIRFDYGDLNVAGGLYAADLLLRDIDYFTYHKILHARNKSQAVSRIISLANEYPLQFMLLRKDGKMRFSTYIKDFISDHPGIYNGRIKNVEILIEGLVGSRGPIGKLSCAGVSRFRRLEDGGNLDTRVHPSETLLLSDYKARRDALVADIPSEQLRIFENIGLETDWLLEFPKAQNNFDFKNITDVKFIISYLCEHDQQLESRDLESMPETEETKIWYSLKYDFIPDAFFIISLEGKMDFTITTEIFAHNQTNPQIRGLCLVAIDYSSGAFPLKINFWSDEYGSASNLYESNNDGIIIVQQLQEEARFRDKTPLTTWHLNIDPDRNPALKPTEGSSAKLDLSKIMDLQFIIQYEYTRP